MFDKYLSGLSKHETSASDEPKRTSRSPVGRRYFLKKSAAGLLGAVAGSSVLAGCDFLEPEVYSQLAPSNFLPTRQGMLSTLGAAYAAAEWLAGASKYRMLHMSDWTTGLMWQQRGGENRAATLMINFTWGTTTNMRPIWYKPYRAIRNANIILDNIDRADISDDLKELFEAEARFVRALSYRDLYNMIGPTPLRTSGEQPLALPRATEAEMTSFIEEEFLAIIPKLPAPGQEPVYGRATNGAARGWLTKFYLNTKQWQKAADMAKAVMDMGTYALYPDYMDMFKVKNERNSEYIWVDTALPDGGISCMMMPGSFPPGFQKHPRTGLTMQSNWANWQSQYKLRDDFVHTFDPNDGRQKPIIKEYIDDAGNLVVLSDDTDNMRSFKFWPDPNAQGNHHGNDIPRIRYADILLSRAEALNELNGPNAESIRLINQVRGRAGLGPLALGDFASQTALRSHILQERAWEFYMEGLRREDLIRHGKYIEFAQERGVENAEPYRRRYPIHQAAMDANPLLEQNPGY